MSGVSGRNVQRNKVLTELSHYDAENDEINVQGVCQQHASEDTFNDRGSAPRYS